MLRVTEYFAKSLNVIENGTIHSSGTVSYSHFIIAVAISCIVSEIKRDIGRKLLFFIVR